MKRKVIDFILLVKAEFIRDIIFMKRYPLEPISFILFMYLILVSIWVGFHQLGGEGLHLERMVLGYCLMQFVMSAQMGWSGQIQNESQTGTLEQLSISGHSLADVLLSRGISQFPRHTLSFFLMLAGCAWALPDAGIQLLGFLNAIPTLFILSLGIFGIAFIFAGLTLIFKRVGFFFQIINFAFLGLFWQDRNELHGFLGYAYDVFPLTVGMSKLQHILSNAGADTPDFPLYWLVATSLASMALGYYLFRLMERRARNMGLLSQY